MTYLIFALTVYRLQLFSTSEWQQIFVVFFLVSAIIGLGQYCLFPDTSYLENLGWDDHRYRLIGAWLDPAFTSLIYTFGIIYFVHLCQKKLSSQRFIFYLIAIFFLTIALFLTYSRSSILALVVTASIFLWQKIKIYRPSKIISQLKSRPLVFIFTILFLFAAIYYIFIFQAQNHLTDSTNLLRTNSLTARAKMIQTQFSSFSFKTWLVGNGFFVTQSSPISNQPVLPVAKQTLPVPDNFFVLLLSFFGLPMTIILSFQLAKNLKLLWCHARPVFFLSLVLLINAQFNQAFFQPFVFLIYALLFCNLVAFLPPPKTSTTRCHAQNC